MRPIDLWKLAEALKIENKIADYSLDSRFDMGKFFGNKGASAAVELTLPAALAGMGVKAKVMEAYGLGFAPASGEAIMNSVGVAAADDAAISCDVVGSEIILLCLEDGVWTPFVQKGPWVFPSVTSAAGGTLTAAMSGRTIDNTGAVGASEQQLPAAVVGLEFSLEVLVAQILSFQPASGELICVPSTGVPGVADKYMGSNEVGAYLTIYCRTAGIWNVKYRGGTWTAEA